MQRGGYLVPRMAVSEFVQANPEMQLSDYDNRDDLEEADRVCKEKTIGHDVSILGLLHNTSSPSRLVQAIIDSIITWIHATRQDGM